MLFHEACSLQHKESNGGMKVCALVAIAAANKMNFNLKHFSSSPLFFFVLFEIQMRESKFNLRNKGNRYSHWIFSRLDTNLNYSILQWRRFFSYELCVLPEEKTCAVEVILLDFRSLTFAMQKLFVFRSSALCANLLCKEVVEEMHFSKFLEKQILK